MNTYGHSQEATDDSVLSHEGLADLVQVNSEWGSRRSIQDQRAGGYEGPVGSNRYQADGNSHQPQPFTSRATSQLSLPSLRLPSPALYSPQPTIHLFQSSNSNGNPSLPPSTYRSSNSFVRHPPFDSPFDPYDYTPASANTDRFSSQPIMPYSSYSGSVTPKGAGFNYKKEETELDWIPSLDRENDNGGGFEGTGGRYQHGIGYERETSGGAGTKGKLSEEKRASRMKKLERRFGVEESQPQAGSGEKRSMKDVMRAMNEEKQRERKREEERSGVDEKGRLVVVGRRKRNAMRWFQGLGVIGVGLGSIGAALLIRPKEKPPPSGTIPLTVLYIFPFISLLITVYLFVLRPCLFARRSRNSQQASQDPRSQLTGMYPLLQPNQRPIESSSWCSCFGDGRNRVPRGGGGSKQAYHPTSINLIVDPSLFSQQVDPSRRAGEKETRRRRRKRREAHRRKQKRTARREEIGSDADTDLLSASSASTSSFSDGSDSERDSTHPSSTNPRSFSSILADGLALEERWLVAKKQVKWNATVDFIMGTAWGGIGVWAIGFNGSNCPPGGFEGYCNLYNTALAFAILLSVAFFSSFTFDCLDLSRSKVSPRHRQQRLTTSSVRQEGRRSARMGVGVV